MFNLPYLATLLGRDLIFIVMIIPAITAAAIGGVSNIVGGIFGSRAQRKANETNLQIARETNAQNLAIYKDQKQYNTDMWNAQNAYNTPTAQRQRYEDAGINPYLALGNISSGSAQSALTAPNAPNMVSPQVQPVTAMSENISNMGNQFANIVASLAAANKTQAETEGIRTDNIYKAGMYQAQLKKLGADTDEVFGRVRLNSLAEYYQNNTMDTSIEQAKQNLDNSVKQGQVLQIQYELAKFDLGFKEKHAEEQFKAELANTISQTFSNYANVEIGKMNAQTNRMNAQTNRMNAQTNRMNAQTNRMNADTTARAVAQQILESAERTSGIKLDNVSKSRSMEYTVGKVKAELQHTQSQAGLLNKQIGSYDIDNFLDRFDTFTRGVSNAANAWDTLFGKDDKKNNNMPPPQVIKIFKYKK